MTVIYRYQSRRRTAANWTSGNEVLYDGEIGYETDTGKFKIGDGVTAWNSIADYFEAGAGGGGGTWGSITGTLSNQTDLNTALSGKVATSVTVNGQALTGNITLTTASIADSSNARYVTDAQLTVIGNTSGTNTGDQNLSSYVVGPASATDNALARFDSTTGKLIQNSSATIADSGAFTFPNTGDVPSIIGATPPSGTENYAGLINAKQGGNGGLYWQQFYASDDTTFPVYSGPSIFQCRARGTLSAPSAVQSGDYIAGLQHFAHDGVDAAGNYVQVFSVESYVSAAVGSGSVPADVVFSTGGSAGGYVEAGRIKDNGNLQWVGAVTGSNLSGTNTGDQDLSSYATTSAVASGYQPLDTQLTSLAGLSYTGNTLKVVRVNAGETDFELATISSGGADITVANTWTAAQTFSLEDAGTNTVLYPAKFRRTSSGTPANGIGVGCQFEVETTAGNNEIGATLEAVTTDVTSTSEDFALVAKTMVGGSTTLVEGGRWVGAQYLAPSGSLSAPSISFSADPDIGMFRQGSNQVGFAAAFTTLAAFYDTNYWAMRVPLVSDLGTATIYGFTKSVLARTSSATEAVGTANCSVITNEGASGAITRTLPSLGSGTNMAFIDNNASHRLTVKPNTGDQIIWTDGTAVSATGSIVSTARYNSFEGVSVDTTTFVVTNATGTWTVTP